jgi:signal transduction histidine kinase
VVLRVADDGPPPPEAVRAALEGRRTDPDRFEFGPYLVATLVDRYGGAVAVERADGTTTVSVTLPRAED